MKAKVLVLVVTLMAVCLTCVTGVSAQEVETEIQFEDEVVVGEETTITYAANVVETPVETDVEVELTLLVDGEEVRTQTTEEEVFEGAELRTEFEHTFDSSGEKEVTVDSVTRALGQEITDSTTATVTVTEADSEEEGDGNETEDDEVDDGGTEDGIGDSTDGGDTEDGAEDDMDDDGDTNGDSGTEGDDATDDVSDDETGEADGGTDDEADGSDDDDAGEGLPGFGTVAALVSLATVAVYTRRR